MTRADPPLPPPPDFGAVFRALWPYNPFPWQSTLAERLTTAPWPQALDLPTACGKTACIDVALWALACQADRPHAERTAPRRIWFAVGRRIVVDEAFARADHRMVDCRRRARVHLADLGLARVPRHHPLAASAR